MALVGEATLDSPILAETLASVPEAVVRLEEIRTLPDEQIRFLVWVDGCEFDEFEAAASNDETIAAWKALTDVGGRRLYRLTLSERGEAVSTYLTAATEDIVILNLSISHEEMRILARIPSRDSLREYAAVCHDMGIDFQLERLYEEEETASDGGGGKYGLTESQREALRCALKMGYFDVPRRTSIGEVADELDVSGQALSTLLRRGQTNLLEHTVGR